MDHRAAIRSPVPHRVDALVEDDGALWRHGALQPDRQFAQQDRLAVDAVGRIEQPRTVRGEHGWEGGQRLDPLLEQQRQRAWVQRSVAYADAEGI